MTSTLEEIFAFLLQKELKSHGGIPIFQRMIWMLAIILPLLLQERSLKQIPDKYSRSRLFNYWGMKNKSQLICKNL